MITILILKNEIFFKLFILRIDLLFMIYVVLKIYQEKSVEFALKIHVFILLDGSKRNTWKFCTVSHMLIISKTILCDDIKKFSSTKCGPVCFRILNWRFQDKSHKRDKIIEPENDR